MKKARNVLKCVSESYVKSNKAYFKNKTKKLL